MPAPVPEPLSAPRPRRGLLLASVGVALLAIAGWRRGERPRWLVLLTFALGIAPLAVLAL
jgi:hypothetical protein